MSELSEILKEEYLKEINKLNKLDILALLEMVEEAMIQPTNEDVEPPPNLPDSDEAVLEMVLKMIPNIEVSEIGWSDVRTTDEGVEIKGAQRQLLEDYLNNIQGSNFADKIRNVSEFYDNGLAMVTSNLLSCLL